MPNYDLIGYGSGKIHKPSSSDHLRIGDTTQIQIGASQDLLIYHDGTDNHIESSDQELNIQTTSQSNVNIGHTDGGTVIVNNDLTVSGDLIVQGDTTTVNTANLLVEDNLILLNSGASSNANDSGIIIERGSTGDNAIIAWDESADKFTLGTTTAAGNSTGDLTITAGDLVLSGLVASGTVQFGSISDGTITVTAFVDEDNMASNSATLIPTQQSVKAYVDAQVTAQDLDFQGDSGGALSIDLDSETLTFTGGTGIDTSGSGNALTIAIDSTVATLAGSQTLTNKTLTSAVLNGTISGTSIKDEDNMASNSASHLATQQSIKAYVDSTVSGGTAQGLSSASNVTITADNDTANSSATDGTIQLIVGSDSVKVAEIKNDRIETNKPLVLSSNAGVSLTASAGATIAVGNILSLNASAELVLSDADHGTEQNKEIIGVALEASTTTQQSILLHTVHGAKVNVKTDGAAVTSGKPVYLDTTAGQVTATAPSAGYVYRVGIALETTTNQTDADILWMPQFIADLG